MNVSTLELAKAKDATDALLNRLGLEAYLFELEPKAGKWELKVECAIDGGWQTTVLDVGIERLLGSLEHEAGRQALLTEWHRSLSACKVKNQ